VLRVVEEEQVHTRRSLKYIRLAAYLADQPSSVARLEMTVAEIESVVGEDLPSNARFPSWWRNDDRRMHARAWLTAGWVVKEMVAAEEKVIFARSNDVR
jgi:hypothetical protein